jgi:hypothetical protein
VSGFDEDELIGVARRDRAPNGARDRVRAAVMATVAGAAATTSSHAAAQTTAATGAKIGGFKIGVAAMLGVGAVAIVGAVMMAGPADEGSNVEPRTDPSVAEETVAAETLIEETLVIEEPIVEEAVVEEAVVEAPAVQENQASSAETSETVPQRERLNRIRAPRMVATEEAVARAPEEAPAEAAAPVETDTRAIENGLIARAIVAMNAGRYDDALLALDEHRTRFPTTDLVPERERARARVLCRQRAAASGVSADRVRSTCP